MSKIILWYFNIDDFPTGQLRSELSVLPEPVSLEINRYHLIEDKKCRIISRLMLQKYVSENFRIWNWKDLKRSPTHKPYLENGPFFSISHSGNFVLIGFSCETELGVDIEQIKKINTEDLAGYFHQEEYVFLKNKNFDEDSFYRVWTRKEALLKAIGIGFLEGLDQVSVLDDKITLEKTWHLSEVQLIEGYKISVCIEKKAEIISKQIDYSQLNKIINEKKYL